MDKIKKFFAPLDAGRVTDSYLIIMLFLFPLFSGFKGYADITFAKFLFLLIATALWLIALLWCFVKNPAPLPKPQKAQYAALVFLLISTLSALISPFFPQTLLGAGRFDGLLSTFVYVLIFLGVSLLTKPKRIHIYAFAAGMTLCCAVAILQLFRINALHLFPDGLTYYDGNHLYSGTFLGTIGNTNLLDAVLCLVVPLCLVPALRERMYPLLIPAALALTIILLAGGSGAHIALLATVPIAMLTLPKSRRTRRFFAALVLLAFFGGILLAYFWPGQSGAIYELSQILHGNLDPKFGSSRIMIWQGCLELIPQRPLLGGGPGTIALRLDIDFSRFVPETGQTLRTSVDNAHNLYLGYLVNTGLLGALAYLSLLALCLCNFFARRRTAMVSALGLAVICGAVHAFFGLGLCISEPFFWIMLALLASVQSDQSPLQTGEVFL